jgi:hypothetical protein
MVRRGSTVRVRQRAPAKAPHTRGFHFLDLLHLVQFAQVWDTKIKKGGWEYDDFLLRMHGLAVRITLANCD